MSKQNYAAITILSLLGSLFTGLPSVAYDPGSVTKTVSVKNHLGQTYGAGARVSLVFRDQNFDLSTSPEALTDANGVAEFQASGAVKFIGLAVAPSVSDQVHALEFVDGDTGFSWPPEADFLSWDQAFEVQLQRANARVVALVGSSGQQLAPAGTRISVYPDEDGNFEYVLPSSGTFGLHLPGPDSGTAGFTIRATPAGKNVFLKQIAVTTTDGVLDPSGDREEVNGAIAIRLVESNISGHLRNADGSPLTLPGGVTGRIKFVRSNTVSGNANAPALASDTFEGAEIAPDGSFAGYLPVLPAANGQPEAYRPQVFLGGDVNLPTFLGQVFYVNAQRQYSSAFAMTDPAESLEVRLPNAGQRTVDFHTVLKGTLGEEDPALIEIRGTQEVSAPWWGRVLTTNGIASYALPDGQYYVDVAPLDSLRPSQPYTLVVSSGVASLQLRDGNYGEDPTIQPFDSSPSAFRVSGLINNHINVVVLDPVTGESLSHEVVAAELQYQVTQNSGIGQGYYQGSRGIIGVQLPKADEYWSQSPVTLRVKTKEWVEQLDPLWASRDYRVDLSGVTPRVFDGETELTPLNAQGMPTFALPLGYANVYGNLVDTDGNPVVPDYEAGKWINAQVQRYIAAENRWDYVTWIQINRSGGFGVELSDGTYRMLIEPNGFENLARTYVPQFVISDNNPNQTFTDFVVQPPQLSLQVTAPGSTSAITNTQVQIRSESAQIQDWMWINETGYANLSLEDGEYEIVVYPPQSGGILAASKTYRLVVNDDQVQVFDGQSPVTSVGNSSPPRYALELATPNFSGVVLSPTGQPIRFAQVVPIDRSTGQEMWEISTQTDIQGRWALNIPREGSYDVYARAPWGTSEFGNSAAISELQVNAQGQVVIASLPNGVSPNSIELRLRYPKWSGVVMDPIEQTPMSNAEVCLFGPTNGVCAATNDSGQWALSMPAGMDSFDQWNLSVRERFNASYSERRWTGNEINSVMSYSDNADTVYRNITLSPQVPNLKIRVVAGGEPVVGAWLSADRPGFWLGGASTDAEGYARLNVDDPTEEFDVQANISHLVGLSSNFASTRATLNLDPSSAVNGVFSATVSLTTPNFRARVVESDGQSPVTRGWAELIAPSGEWLGNSDISSQGNISMFIATDSETVTYSLRVSPNGSQALDNVRTSFDLGITPSGQLRVEFKGSAVSAPQNVFALQLSRPNVAGKVVRPDGVTGVRDSWVVPIDSASDWYLWQLGTNSGQGGSFAMNLEDGVYRLEASVPWNLAGLARSSRCEITVTGGNLAQIGQPCQDPDPSKILLKLREPNLKFKLVRPDQTPVVFANVGMRIADLNINAQSDREGYVSMFLDIEEMGQAADRYISRGWLSDADQDTSSFNVPINFWVDPPWGAGDIVRWECQTGDSEPLCDQVAGIEKPAQGQWTWSAPAGTLQDVQFKAPNTEVSVLIPTADGNVSAGEGAWVNIFRERVEVWGTWREWIAGSNTNRQGKAVFLVEGADLSATLSVEINAPWHLRSTYPSKYFDGLRLAATQPLKRFDGQVFVLPTKNLTLSVLEPGTERPSRGSWISVESVAGGNSTWLTGSGTDDRGRTSFRLEPQVGAQYRLTVHPGPGSQGVRFSCLLEGDGTKLVSANSGGCGAANIAYSNPASPDEAFLTLTLGQGNTRGTVINGSTSEVVSGAIVLAEAVDNGNVVQRVSSVTNSRGEYFLDLDQSRTWRVKVLYSNPADASPFVQRVDATFTGSDRDDTLEVIFGQQQAELRLNGSSLPNNAIAIFRQG